MRWTVGFAVWTLFVWVGRVRNVAADESLAGFEVVWRIGLALTFVVLGVLTLVLCRRAATDGGRRLARFVRVFAVFTAVVWTVRAVGIVLDAEHDVGFKVVHTVLAVGSIGLAWRADRELDQRRARGFGPVSPASVS